MQIMGEDGTGWVSCVCMSLGAGEGERRYMLSVCVCSTLRLNAWGSTALGPWIRLIEISDNLHRY